MRCLLLESGAAPHHLHSPALAATDEVLAVCDQPLVQLASQHWDAVRPGLILFRSAVLAGGAASVSLHAPAWLR